MKDGRTDKTFFIRTPADLLEKLRWEMGILLDSAPFDLQQRAYMVMNCAITAWQMKDWVYNTLNALDRLKALDDYAERHIKIREDFGTWCQQSNATDNISVCNKNHIGGSVIPSAKK